MNPHTYVVTLPERTTRDEWLRWQHWLPNLQQMWSAARLETSDALDPYEQGRVTVSMRQGLGMIVVLALAAGVIPLLANLWVAVPMGASVPLARLADFANQLLGGYSGNVPLEIAGHTVQSVAGLPPRIPGFFAATLSAKGLWLNWPLNWLAIWIVYGTLVFGSARLLGATNTLQRFFAATSFAAVPLLLTGLGPLPLIGPLAILAGLIWAALVYFQSMRFVTGLDGGRTFVAMALPAALVVAVPVMVAVFAALISIF
jgi:hypothetical protein